MIDGIIFANGNMDTEFKRERFHTVSPIVTHWGVTMYQNGEVVGVYNHKEIALIAAFLNQFLADAENK